MRHVEQNYSIRTVLKRRIARAVIRLYEQSKDLQLAWGLLLPTFHFDSP